MKKKYALPIISVIALVIFCVEKISGYSIRIGMLPPFIIPVIMIDKKINYREEAFSIAVDFDDPEEMELFLEAGHISFNGVFPSINSGNICSLSIA